MLTFGLNAHYISSVVVAMTFKQAGILVSKAAAVYILWAGIRIILPMTLASFALMLQGRGTGHDTFTWLEFGMLTFLLIVTGWLVLNFWYRADKFAEDNPDAGPPISSVELEGLLLRIVGLIFVANGLLEIADSIGAAVDGRRTLGFSPLLAEALMVIVGLAFYWRGKAGKVGIGGALHKAADALWLTPPAEDLEPPQEHD